MKKFEIVKHSRSPKEIVKRIDWFSYCKNNKIPYIVVVEKRGKYAVEYDLIAFANNLNFRIDDKTKKKITRLFKEFLKPYEDELKRYGKRKKMYEKMYLNKDIVQSFDVGKFHVHVGNIHGILEGLRTREEAIMVAERLFDILYGFLTNRKEVVDCGGKKEERKEKEEW